MNRLCSGYILLFTAFLIISGLTVATADAQELSEEEPKRLSIGLNAGWTYGSAGDGMFGALAGNFEIPSFREPIFGGTLSYAVSPAWSIEVLAATGSFQNQFEDDPGFTNDYLFGTLRGVTNLNNLLGLRWGVARVFNPYLSFGLGMIRSDVVAEDLDSRSLALMATGGAGISVYLGRSADLFAQYDFYLAGDDLLDSVSGESGTDQFAAVTGGLRIHFGRGNRKHASWPPPRVREPGPPSEEPAPEPEPEPEPEIDMKEEVRAWLTGFSATLQSPLFNREEYTEPLIRSARERIEERIAEEERLAAERADREARIFVDQPEAGHYVQYFSFLSRSSAERVREELLEFLSDRRDETVRVVIQEYGDYHRVLAGGFSRYSEARELFRLMSEEYPEAFIITFPRDE